MVIANATWLGGSGISDRAFIGRCAPGCPTRSPGHRASARRPLKVHRGRRRVLRSASKLLSLITNSITPAYRSPHPTDPCTVHRAGHRTTRRPWRRRLSKHAALLEGRRAKIRYSKFSMEYATPPRVWNHMLYERIVLIMVLIREIRTSFAARAVFGRQLGGVRSDLSSTVLHDSQHDTTGE